MKIRSFISKTFLLAILFVVSYSIAKPTYNVYFKTDALRLSETTINQLANKALQIENGQVAYQDVNIYVYSKRNGEENYLVVDLLQPNSYGIVSYRLDLFQSEVVKITQGYVEEEALDPTTCGTCPDPEVQFLLTYIKDNPGATDKCIKAAETAAKAKNYKFVSLLEDSKTKQTVLDYLTCPKFIFWSRIGHGQQNGSISLGTKGANGTITKAQFTSAPFKDLLKDKIFFFNSCYVGGKSAGLGKAMVDAGAKYFHGGDDVVLGFNTSEGSTEKFLVDIITNGTDLFTSFKKNMISPSVNRDETRADKWRAWGTAPIYPFKQTTDIATPFQTLSNSSLFTITTTPYNVFFNNVSGNLSIYDQLGKLQFKNQNLSSNFIWDMKNSNGSYINTGNYIAVITNGNSNVTKTFTIVK